MRDRIYSVILCTFLLVVPGLGQKASNIKFQVIASTGGYPDGGTLVADSKGNLYGATNLGNLLAGAVYELSPAGKGKWNLIILDQMLNFPEQGMAIDAQGNLYGADTLGGSFGEGEVFKFTANGDGTFSESTIYSFPGINQPGGPNGDLLVDAKGNVFGTTRGNGNGGEEVAYELQNTGNGYNYIQLYVFCSLQNCADGLYPNGGLIEDAAGNIYGTTISGGNTTQAGVVYKLSQTNGTWTETVLYEFSVTDGQSPSAGLTFDSKGSLYGTTSLGGSKQDGTVYEVSSTGVFSTIYNFPGAPGPAYSYGKVTFDGNGVILGTTTYGGKSNGGSVFALKLGQSGQWNLGGLYSFPYLGNGGGGPVGGVFLRGGTLFGVTALSETYGYGEVFEFSR